MERSYVAFDLESTGLYPERGDRVVEIGALSLRPDGTEIGRFSRLANPGRPIPLHARAIHGITDAMVASAPPVRRVLAGFLALLAQLGGRDAVVLIAHNAKFDAEFLAYEFLRCDLGPFDFGVIDTLALARTFFPELPDHKLPTVAAHLGLDLGAAHRALADALRAAGIWRATCVRRRDPNYPLLPLLGGTACGGPGGGGGTATAGGLG
jgi:DNA polymerase III subunit epsilon